MCAHWNSNSLLENLSCEDTRMMLTTNSCMLIMMSSSVFLLLEYERSFTKYGSMRPKNKKTNMVIYDSHLWEWRTLWREHILSKLCTYFFSIKTIWTKDACKKNFERKWISGGEWHVNWMPYHWKLCFSSEWRLFHFNRTKWWYF